MGFRQADSEGRGGYARVWEMTSDNGKKATARLTTWLQKRDEEGNPTGEFETDFSDGYVSFIGSAYSKLKTLNIPKEQGLTIQIKSCEVKTYRSEKAAKAWDLILKHLPNNLANAVEKAVEYLGKMIIYRPAYSVYAFDIPDGNGTKKAAVKTTKKSTKSKTKKEAPVEDDDDLPFN